MSLISIVKLPLSAEQGWPELERVHPRLVRVFAFIVLPLSLLPPAMLYYAGNHHPELFAMMTGDKDWGMVAAVFFGAELATLAGMGWLIRQVAASAGLTIDYHDAYLLAAIAPIPLWLSSLALLVPSLAVGALVALVALALSCGIVYHGIEGFCHMREDVTAASIVQVVIGAGLVAWALLLLLPLVL